MIEIRLKSTVLVFILGLSPYGSPATPNKSSQGLAPNFVVQIKHMQLDLRPNGGTASTCAVVLPNLKIHVEKRVQHLPEHVAKLTISESMLTPDQMQQLQTILDAEPIKALPHFEFKREFVANEGFEGYQAKVVRDKRVQVVGYENPLSKISSVPESLRNQWAAAQQALKPLMNWVDEMTSNLPTGQGRSTLCESGTSQLSMSDRSRVQGRQPRPQ
jgi:hypothetical protein